jgi:hypothetical protein
LRWWLQKVKSSLNFSFFDTVSTIKYTIYTSFANAGGTNLLKSSTTRTLCFPSIGNRVSLSMSFSSKPLMNLMLLPQLRFKKSNKWVWSASSLYSHTIDSIGSSIVYSAWVIILETNVLLPWPDEPQNSIYLFGNIVNIIHIPATIQVNGPHNFILCASILNTDNNNNDHSVNESLEDDDRRFFVS